MRLGTVLGLCFGLFALLSLLNSFFQWDLDPLWIYGGLLFFSFLGSLYVIITQQMLVYVTKRLIEAFVTLLIIATLTFLMLRFLPGGPFDSEKALPPEIKANIDAKYGLDKPLLIQYETYIVNLFKGDFGQSYKFIGRTVSDIIADAYPISFQLGIYALILSFLVGVPLGVLAASKHNTWIDNLTMIVAMSGVAVPSFLTAPILILVFSIWNDWLPPALWEGPEYYILPVIVLGVRPAAYIARLTRASVLEVIQADFVRTAKAKGLDHFTILFKHVLRNSLIPVLTYAGPLVAGILSGTFIVEVIFNIPGMGRHFVMSVTNRDYPLVMALTLLFGFSYVIANLIVDLMYGIVDPRIRVKS
ncbi:MAG: ABC transporter permease [Bdellovibrionales bacterium]